MTLIISVVSPELVLQVSDRGVTPLHQNGRRVARVDPDGTFEVTQPRGMVRATSPPRADFPW